MGMAFSCQRTWWRLTKKNLYWAKIGIPTYQLQGHSPEGCMTLSLLVSTEGHRDYLGSCHLTDSALPGPGSRSGSSWNTAWGQREKVRFLGSLLAQHAREGRYWKTSNISKRRQNIQTNSYATINQLQCPSTCGQMCPIYTSLMFTLWIILKQIYTSYHFFHYFGL